MIDDWKPGNPHWDAYHAGATHAGLSRLLKDTQVLADLGCSEAVWLHRELTYINARLHARISSRRAVDFRE